MILKHYTLKPGEEIPEAVMRNRPGELLHADFDSGSQLFHLWTAEVDYGDWEE